jgi:serine/threonine-protein kinase
VLLKKLGDGAFGDVYQAHDTQLDRDVALKLLKPWRSPADTTPRLLAEARMLARVRHPNVAAVYGAGEHDGRAGLWMELVRGANLEDLLEARGSMSACEAALVGLDLCRALSAVHAAGLVHRDVKASNVLREVGGRIVLTDFGAGHLRGLEPTRQVAGTPVYVAPEVLAGSEATALSDIYSLGVVLFRLVTLDYPRRGDRLCNLPQAPSVSTATSLRDLRPDLPDAFAEAVERALAFDPAARPQSAGALRAALGAVLGASGSGGRPGGARRRRRPTAPGSRARTGGLSTAAARRHRARGVCPAWPPSSAPDIEDVIVGPDAVGPSQHPVVLLQLGVVISRFTPPSWAL